MRAAAEIAVMTAGWVAFVIAVAFARRWQLRAQELEDATYAEEPGRPEVLGPPYGRAAAGPMGQLAPTGGGGFAQSPPAGTFPYAPRHASPTDVTTVLPTQVLPPPREEDERRPGPATLARMYCALELAELMRALPEGWRP